MEEKIKALLDVGMTDEQIMSILGLTEEEYLNALYETEEPVEEAPKEELHDPHDNLPELEPYSGEPKGKTPMDENEFNYMKELRNKGYFCKEISKHIGRSESFVQQITSSCDTFEDVTAYRAKIRSYQRKIYGSTKRAKSNADRREERKKEYEASKSATGFNRPYTKEEFDEAKRMHGEFYSVIAISRAQHRSQSFINRILKYNSYEELLEFRKKDAARRRGVNQLEATVVPEPKPEPEPELVKPEPVKSEPEEEPAYVGRRKDTGRPVRVNEEVFNNIKNDYALGMTINRLMTKFKLSRGTINHIIKSESLDGYFKSRREEHLMYDKRYKVDDNIEFEGEKETISPELVELRTMNDYLARIVEALESKPKKRGWFGK